jgi:hypothetical protein
LPYEASDETHYKNHCDYHHGREEEMNNLIHHIGELVKSILKLILLGETPDEPTRHDHEKASD